MPYQPQYYYPNNQYQTRPIVSTLKGRPVTGIEEVRAAAIDFDGSISYFPDVANGKIYTKQCNVDGTAQLNMYELKEIPISSPSTDYVTREEFNAAIQQLLAKTNLAEKSSDQAQKSQTSTQEFNFK